MFKACVKKKKEEEKWDYCWGFILLMALIVQHIENGFEGVLKE